jgi:hypothetical protein
MEMLMTTLIRTDYKFPPVVYRSSFVVQKLYDFKYMHNFKKARFIVHFLHYMFRPLR